VLEGAYGHRLEYEFLSLIRPGRIACRLADYHPGNIDHSGQLDAYLEWFADSQARLRKAINDLGGLSLLREHAQEA